MTTSPFLLRALLVLAMAVGFFYNLHAIPLFDLDEGAFSEATREMLQRGDFISPYLNGVPRFDKPVFIHWLQMASVSLFGFTEFALRLPSAVAASLWVTAVYAFLRTLREERIALFAAIAMATSLEIPIIAKAATADAVLNLFITTAMLAAYLFYHTRRRRWLYACFLLMGLGFLTKGPVAVLIPAATTLMFDISKRNFRDWLRNAFNPVGIAVFLIVALPWYIAQYLHQGDAFIAGFFLKHNIDRFEGAMEGHGGNLFYYFPVVLLGVLPYTTVLLKAVSRVKHLWHDDLGRFALLWFCFVFVFFSLSGTKLPHYVVYGYGGLFILMALSCQPLAGRGWLLLPPLLLFLGLLALPDLIGHVLPNIHDAYVRDMLSHYNDYFTSSYRWFFLACAAITVVFMFDARLPALAKLYACGLLTVAGISAQLMPVIGALQQSPIKEAALYAKRHDYSVVMWRLNTPSFDVYSQQIVERRAPRPGDVVLTKSVYLSQLGKTKVLYEKNGIALVRVLPDSRAH
ncbi:MAG: glycosyltransferase family 39 protein [Gammaproteobacteria bacterium]|jgi:4-amino-4-deoxy-L-arabinose transferase-like glycosyltransferase